MGKQENPVKSFLKSWDIYRKLPSDLVESSNSGAAMSLIVIIIIVLLFFSELSTYLSPQLISDLQVDVSALSE